MVLGYEKKVVKPRRKVERKPQIPHIPKTLNHKQDCDVSVHDLIFHKDENIETTKQMSMFFNMSLMIIQREN